jgi:hypothetical protein
MKRIITAALLLVFPLASVMALSWLGVDGGMLYLFNAEQDSGPNPLLMTVGLSMPLAGTGDGLIWDIRYHAFATYYQFANGRASPVEVEAADSLWTLGLATETSLGYLFALSDKIRLGGTASLGGMFRFPLVPVGSGGDFWKDTFVYLLLRFLFVGAEFRFDWKVQERLTLSTAVGTYYPVFRFFELKNVAFWDQITLNGILSLRFSLPSKDTPEG